jgi:hypothetical protein
MPGSAAQIKNTHPSVSFLVRLVLVSIALLWLAKLFTVETVGALLPIIRNEVTALDGNLSVQSLALAREDAGDAVLMRANLLSPMHFQDHIFYPLGYGPHAAGWYRIHLNAAAVLQSSVIFLILILSWPQRSMFELAARCMIALLLLSVLFAADAPLELLGNYQQAVIVSFYPNVSRPLFVWVKFLEGGGKSVLALAFAATAITIARTSDSRLHQHRK